MYNNSDPREGHAMNKCLNFAEKFYWGLCLAATIALTLYCIHLYILDDDLVELQYKDYQDTEEDVYPSLTVCFPLNVNYPVHDEKLKKWDSNLTSRAYKFFLKGDCNSWGYCYSVKRNENWTYVDYDSVTINMEDFLENFVIIFNDGDVINYQPINKSLVAHGFERGGDKHSLKELNYYVNIRNSMYKCFTFDIPNEHQKSVKTAEILMNADSFPEKKINPGNADYFISMSYPNQVIFSLKTNEVFVNNLNLPTPCYQHRIVIGSVEVLKRRNKATNPCVEEGRNYDQYKMEMIANKIGCIPKHWKVDMPSINYCKTNDEYKSAEEEFHKKINPPCKSIEKLSQTSYDIDLGNKCTFTGSWRLMMTFYFYKETNYKEITMVRAFCFQTLIGNAGKY